MESKSMLYADHHGHVHEWSKCGVHKLGCLSCCVQVQSVHILNLRGRVVKGVGHLDHV